MRELPYTASSRNVWTLCLNHNVSSSDQSQNLHLSQLSSHSTPSEGFSTPENQSAAHQSKAEFTDPPLTHWDEEKRLSVLHSTVKSGLWQKSWKFPTRQALQVGSHLCRLAIVSWSINWYPPSRTEPWWPVCKAKGQATSRATYTFTFIFPPPAFSLSSVFVCTLTFISTFTFTSGKLQQINIQLKVLPPGHLLSSFVTLQNFEWSFVVTAGCCWQRSCIWRRREVEKVRKDFSPKSHVWVSHPLPPLCASSLCCCRWEGL